MPRQPIDQIISGSDEFGLLQVRPLPAAVPPEQSRLAASFEEINLFIDRHGRPPSAEVLAGKKSAVVERGLAYRLAALRRDRSASEMLKAADRHALLIVEAVASSDADVVARQAVEGSIGHAQVGHPKPGVEPLETAAATLSLDEIIALDDELLSGPADEIYTFRHARDPSERPDRVAERRRSVDFHLFKPLLDACLAELEAGRRTTRRFANEQEIKAGDFYVLDGVTAYVAEVNDPHIRGKTNRKNARLRVIFDNGTEGDHLLRSFARMLYADPNGRRISDPEAGPLFEQQVTTGHIYVVRSLSQLDEIARIRDNLVKIGVTSGAVSARLAGAETDPTFLFAPVKLVETHELKNADPRVVENLLHRFFVDARLDIDIPDRFGKPYKPREWFLLPLDVVSQAVQLLMDRSITGYRFDAATGSIVKR